MFHLTIVMENIGQNAYYNLLEVAMGQIMNTQRAVEKKKRFLFLGTETLGLLLTFWASPIIGIPFIAVGAFFGYKWFEFRAKNGMRF